MIDPKIENFLEKVDMNYLFCLLAKLEAGRLSQLPVYVRNHLGDKFSVLSMRHVADNEVPDYISEIAESELVESQARAAKDPDDPADMDLAEETFDDSLNFTDEPKPEPVNPFGQDDEDYNDNDFDDSDYDDDEDEDDEEDED